MKLTRLVLAISALVVINSAHANVWDNIKNYFQGTVDAAKAQAVTYGLKKIVESNIGIFNKTQPSESDVNSFVTGYGYANSLISSVTGITLPAETNTIVQAVLKYLTFLKPLYNQLVNNPNTAQKIVQFTNWVKENSGELKAQIDQLKSVFNLPK
ncbi:MAG: hypothetical protein ACOYT8_06895 [Candidatus Dependentiae bacterium]